MKLFVWLSGLRDPEPQLLDMDDEMQVIGAKIKPLAKHIVADEATLDECVGKYPLEVKNEN